MRGISRVPFVAFLGIFVVVTMFAGRAAAGELVNSREPFGDTGLYTPQSTAADRALDPMPGELYPIAPVPRVISESGARRTSGFAAISSRRVTAALTLLLAAQLNTPGFRASLGSIPQSGTALGLLPGVAVANGKRTQGDVPVRRHLARRRAPARDAGPETGFDPKLTAFYVGEKLLLH